MEQSATINTSSASRIKFIVGGLIIIAAVIYLIVSSTQASAQYFLTISEMQARSDELVASGQIIRVSGAVIGDTIDYDPQNMILKFTVADIPGDNSEIEAQGGLAKVLHDAVVDPNRTRIQVVYNNVMPDLLRDEAQAIMTGYLGQDGVFHADELLLKCPTKYEEAVPEQAGS